MKGLVLAGGLGRRMMPLTESTHKTVLRIHDKPLIWFPINTLRQSGIEDIVISTNVPGQIQDALLEEDTGVNLSYVLEPNPGSGNGRALYAARQYIKDHPVLVVLGDIYLGFNVSVPADLANATIYVAPSGISKSGVVEMGSQGEVLSFEEYPAVPRGIHFHMGVTFYPADLIDLIERMGVEKAAIVTDVSNAYLRNGRLNAVVCNGGWFNINTPHDLERAREYRRMYLQCPAP